MQNKNSEQRTKTINKESKYRKTKKSVNIKSKINNSFFKEIDEYRKKMVNKKN